jgi:hypothetical protein
MPQLMPAGDEVIVPVPVLLAVSVYVLIVNVAVTVRAWLIVTVQVPVPEHAPPQPVNVHPVVGVCDRLTTVPWL